MKTILIKMTLLVFLLYFALNSCRSINERNENIYSNYLVASYTNDNEYILKYSKYIDQKLYFKKLKVCAEQMNFICQQFLARRYIESDVHEGVFWYRLSFLNGNYFAAYILGDLHSTDKYGIKNIQLSKEYFEIAAMNGVAITSYIRFLKSHFPALKQRTIMWENIVFKLYNNNKTNDIAKFLYGQYILKHKIKYININKQLDTKEDILFNHIINVMKSNKENSDREILKTNIK